MASCIWPKKLKPHRMSLTFQIRKLIVGIFFIFSSFLCFAQQRENKKYPALLWEIRGNGLKKPSYLFGTMHVSNKLVFHLSDSFYAGIKNSDVVALELDPQLWQDQLFRYQKMENNLRFYTQGAPNDYVTEKSFQLDKYEDKIKAALSEEPTIINGLLYRTFQPSADFEEDTYLDLYIYQTGKRLGKQATGVENFFETERLILEATQDMMKDKKKRKYDSEGEGVYYLEKKTQDAYRKGDLDMLDSLEKIMQASDAYLEKFLYRRNEIQANSIDSIIKKQTLFVGVGAAHLPGKRGVIELLRKKGYTLRPILMQDRDANLRDDIEKVRVPVTFSPFTSDDGLFGVQLPGKLYKRLDGHNNDSWQYADMSNGAYYMVTRVKTHAYFFGQTEETVLRKVDSLLYENIPGKILKKTPILKNGYKGFDITNKTRRGDLQRYNIIVTPFEVLVFKMSGNNNYVDGREADEFFASISLRNTATVHNWVDFKPKRGGFKVRFPQIPFEHRNDNNYDAIPCWEYEAHDPDNGDAFWLVKKTIQNYHFIEEDTFALDLAEESFGLSDFVSSELSRQHGFWRGYPSLDASYSLKDGSIARVRCMLKGTNYYVLAARSKTRNKTFPDFFDSFEFANNNYRHFSDYTDTLVNISVSTPVVPDIDATVRGLMDKAGGRDYYGPTEYNSYWPADKMALFQDDSTGETVYVTVQSYPKYYYPKDSAAFWRDEINEKRIKETFILYSKVPIRADSISGYHYILADTNSMCLFNNWIFLKDNRLYHVMNMYDSLQNPDEFVRRFFQSIKPTNRHLGSPLFENKLKVFFEDLNSKDSATSEVAKKAIPNVYFGAYGVPLLVQAIENLSYNEKDYFDTKSKLINELGYINDSSVNDEIVSSLKQIYERAADTNAFQNIVFKALARHKTRESYALLKSLLIQDPPVFENSSDYNYLFQDITDSLNLAKSLFPEVLQLSTIDDYRDNLHSLLTTLVDSGYLGGNEYATYFSKIYFEAKIQWKKQLSKDEMHLQKGEDDPGPGRNNRLSSDDSYAEENTELDDYAVLLLPFYEKNVNVRIFIDKLLRSSNLELRLRTAILLLRHDLAVSDTIILSLASNDKYRFELYKKLEEINRLILFPKKFLTQVDIARSQLSMAYTKNELFAIEFVDKKIIQVKQNRGYVYYFRYKPEKDDDWQIGISGLQPQSLKEISDNDDLVKLTNRKIRPNQSLEEQFDRQLKRVIFGLHKSAASFYTDNDYFLGRADAP